MVQLPLVPSIPNYRVSTTLGGEQFVFDVRWNGRAETWFLNVLTSDAQPIRTGIRLVLGAGIGDRVADSRFPAGRFVVSDLSRSGREAGLDDLGTRVVVLFLTNEELGLG